MAALTLQLDEMVARSNSKGDVASTLSPPSTKVASYTPISPVCAPATSGVSYCYNCGQQLRTYYKFCPGCGAKKEADPLVEICSSASEPTLTASRKESKEKKKKKHHRHHTKKHYPLASLKDADPSSGLSSSSPSSSSSPRDTSSSSREDSVIATATTLKPERVKSPSKKRETSRKKRPSVDFTEKLTQSFSTVVVSPASVVEEPKMTRPEKRITRSISRDSIHLNPEVFKRYEAEMLAAQERAAQSQVSAKFSPQAMTLRRDRRSTQTETSPKPAHDSDTNTDSTVSALEEPVRRVPSTTEMKTAFENQKESTAWKSDSNLRQHLRPHAASLVSPRPLLRKNESILSNHRTTKEGTGMISAPMSLRRPEPEVPSPNKAHQRRPSFISMSEDEAITASYSAPSTIAPSSTSALATVSSSENVVPLVPLRQINITRSPIAMERNRESERGTGVEGTVSPRRRQSTTEEDLTAALDSVKQLIKKHTQTSPRDRQKPQLRRGSVEQEQSLTTMPVSEPTNDEKDQSSKKNTIKIKTKKSDAGSTLPEFPAVKSNQSLSKAISPSLSPRLKAQLQERSESFGTNGSNIKLVVLGSEGVGKSCLTLRFVQGIFTHHHDPTIEDSYTKLVVVNETQYVTEILDTAGTEEMGAVRNMYMKKGHGFALVYAIDSMTSFQEARTLYHRILSFREEDDIAVVLIGNKSDRESDRQVSKEEAIETAREFNCPLIETSAKDNHNVEMAFAELIRGVLCYPTSARNQAVQAGQPGCLLS